MIPSSNRTEISVKGDTSVLLGIKGSMSAIEMNETSILQLCVATSFVFHVTIIFLLYELPPVAIALMTKQF